MSSDHKFMLHLGKVTSFHLFHKESQHLEEIKRFQHQL